MAARNPAIVDVMAPQAEFELEIVAGPRFELLIALFAADRDGTGELWLHLLGLALESGAGDAAGFVDEVARVGALELRRHLLGRYVPTWCELVGTDTIERAARGDADAARRLLRDRRYYGGKAKEALGSILPLSAKETKAHVVAELRTFASGSFEPQTDALAADAEAKRELVATVNPCDLIDRAAGGYRYEAEPEFPRVVLVPHLAAAPSILLCQHRDARLICYPAAREEPMLALGRALADEKRIRLLQLLRSGDATLAELAEGVGLAKSTTHHHLGHLRSARLVALRGNARGYAYTIDEAGFAAGSRLLDSFL